jgi:hypothetical protein
MTTYTGGCTCGAVRYEIAAEPLRAFYCQCRSCQRDTGAGHAPILAFPRTALKVTGRVTEFARPAESGAGMAKGFCATCGAPLYGKPGSRPEVVGIYAGSLDDPSRFAPQMVVFTAGGQPWDQVDPALKKFPARPG